MSKQQSPTLEQRITASLSNGSASSATLMELIDEVEAAATDAAATAQSERKAATLDLSRDIAQADVAARLAELTAERLRAALPRLRGKLAEAISAEAHARWLTEYQRVEAQHAALVKEFAERYPQLQADLLDLFGRIAQCDKECGRINSAASDLDGEHRRLQPVELVARDMDRFTTSEPSIVETVRLIDPVSGEQTWPPPTPSIAASFAMSMMPAPHPGANWHKDLAARQQEARDEANRVAAYNEQRARDSEERANQQGGG